MHTLAYYDADTDTAVYRVVPELELDDDISTIETESTTTMSATTIQSDDVPGYFVIHHGRQQPARESLVRTFPTDNVRRHILRYIARKAAFGGDYVGPVRDVLAPLQERRKYALELGTRTGTWTQSMATKFPHVQFRSLDVVPIIAHAAQPNVIFEVYDFTERLLLEDESQDAVFMNIVMEMVRDYPALLREVHRVLRPGGLLHIGDYCPQIWDSEDPSKPAYRTNPMGCRFMELVREQASIMGIDPDTLDKLPGWLAPGSNVWGETKSEYAGFERVQLELRLLPFYPHDGFSCMSMVDGRIAPFLRHLGVGSVQDMFGVLRDRGVTKEEAERLIEQTVEELKQPEKCVYQKIYYMYATKK